jgi:ABC-2 type transport system permease protein
MTLRYWYLLRSSWPRLLELVYWPAMNMILWGLLQMCFKDADSSAASLPISGTLVGAVLLWNVLSGGQFGFTFSFLEEMWSRNIASLLISPLRPWEFGAALMTMSLIRLLIGMIPVTALAFVLFSFNIYALGLSLIPFFANLVLTGAALGLLIVGLILRNGLGVESLSFSIMFLLLPITCVYYPVSILPHWLQPVAWSLAPTYVFEAMRAALYHHEFRGDLMLQAFALNLVYIALGFAAFLWLLRDARQKGVLLALGE